MKWEISFDENENILFVTAHGLLDWASSEAMTRESLDVIKEKNCRRCLVDNRDVSFQKIGTLDIHSFPKLYDQLGFPRNLRLAEVTMQEHWQDFHFFENVCRNRGYTVSVFLDVESAVQWLKQEAG